MGGGGRRRGGGGGGKRPISFSTFLPENPSYLEMRRAKQNQGFIDVFTESKRKNEEKLNNEKQNNEKLNQEEENINKGSGRASTILAGEDKKTKKTLLGF